jgi:uncharacterized membrane protein
VSILRRRAPSVPAAAFVVSGTAHLVRPQLFESLMPRVLPDRHHRTLIYLSGVLELILGIALFRRWRWAGLPSAALLVAVLPANIQMALDAGSGRNPGFTDHRLAAWLRVPLQAPLIWAALQVKASRD